MAYQCKQPCLPPAACAPHGPTQATDPCAPECVSPGNTSCADACGPSPAIPYQSKQPCPLPPIYVQPCAAETVTSCAPTCDSSCQAGPQPAPQACFALAAEAQPWPPRSTCTLCSSPDPEASPAACREAAPSYVMPGSTVSLHPSGAVSVNPGPAEGADCCGSVFLPPYTPHFP
ncbi:small proline-rich protein 2H-like [Hemicordylus capensis]|uniref:small proline-rich protein 2H-like n=1 Tax=Hemicordylus capensis TaxID=884348 RepID=UPI0023038140|nr:small proline-rich protein 2H-like [Hemicordylus capensis]